VLELADRFLLCGLKRLCEARLAAALSPDTAAGLLAAADRFTAQQLLQVVYNGCYNNIMTINIIHFIIPTGSRPSSCCRLFTMVVQI
jgi:hypothetical protein